MTDDTIEISVSDLEPEVDDLAARLLAWLERGELPPGSARVEATPVPPRRLPAPVPGLGLR